MGRCCPQRAGPLFGLRGILLAMNKWLTAVLGLIILGLGIVIGRISLGPYSLPLFAAAGTWAGGLGTIGAIFWAVHAFRVEQRRLERQRAEQQAATAAALVAAEQRVVDLAEMVTIRVFTASGEGSPPQVMNSVRVEVINAADLPASDIVVELTDLTASAGGLSGSLERVPTLASGASSRMFTSIDPIAADGMALSGKQDITDLHPARMTFTLEGRRWQRVGSARPVRL